MLAKGVLGSHWLLLLRIVGKVANSNRRYNRPPPLVDNTAYENKIIRKMDQLANVQASIWAASWWEILLPSHSFWLHRAIKPMFLNSMGNEKFLLIGNEKK